jgi:hypothetical protein
LGDPFFYNYVVSFDYGKSTIKIATSQVGDQNGALSSHNLSAGGVVGIIAGSLVAVVGVIYLIRYFMKK